MVFEVNHEIPAGESDKGMKFDLRECAETLNIRGGALNRDFQALDRLYQILGMSLLRQKALGTGLGRRQNLPPGIAVCHNTRMTPATIGRVSILSARGRAICRHSINSCWGLPRRRG
jgi:hypothetical protein